MKKREEKMDELRWWILWFEKRFAHNDYLKLNKEYKQIYFKQCAEEVLLAIDIKKKGINNGN